MENLAATERKALQSRDLEHRRHMEALAATEREALQNRDLEHQTRTVLRESYTDLLRAQRDLREKCLMLAARPDDDLARSTHDAMAEFIIAYHRINLDAPEELWKDLRVLRGVLEEMEKAAAAGDVRRCDNLSADARRARQNVERQFRHRLGHRPFRDWKTLKSYEKRHKVTRTELS